MKALQSFYAILTYMTGAASALIVPTTFSAQTVHPESITSIEAKAEKRDTSIQSGSGLALQRVSLTIKDSTVAFVVEQLAKKAGMQAVYDAENPAMKRRISFVVRDMTIQQALKTALQETGLEAIIAPDGATIVVRSSTNARRGDAGQRQQGGQLTGRVVDSASKRGISGARVSVRGLQRNTMSDSTGSFTLRDLPHGTYMLVFQMLGYRTMERSFTISDSTPGLLVVPLVPVATVMSEIVTTAIGTQRRIEVGHDIATINVDSILRTAPIRSVSDMLAVARIPGVVVEPTSGLPGAPSRIRMRGIGSILGDNDPIVIIDGVRMNAATSGKQMESFAQDGTIVTSRLDDIDPETIERIEVLRGPSAGTLYGTDAANGVIIITTKRARPGPSRWNFRAAHDWAAVPGAPAKVYQGWGKTATGVGNGECVVADVAAGTCHQDSVTVYDLRDPLLTDEASGRTTSGTLTVDGGVNQLRYNVTGTLQDVLGPLKMANIDRVYFRQALVPIPGWMNHPSGLRRLNLTAKVGAEMGQGFDTWMSMQWIQQARRNHKVDANSGIGAALWSPDTLQWKRGPRSTHQYTEDVSRVILGMQSVWNRFNWLALNLDAGVDRSSKNETQVSETYLIPNSGVPFVDAYTQKYQSRREGRSGETTLSFNMRGSTNALQPQWLQRYVDLRPTFGLNITQRLVDRLNSSVDTAAPTSSGGFWTGNASTTGDSTRNATAGIYADVRIGLFQRLYTSVGIRRDIGSTFGRRSGMQNYPKLNTSWLVSDEPFFPKTLPINTLRFRLALGMSGVQPIVGAVDGGFVVGQAVVNGLVVQALQPSILGNPELRPERSYEYEYGFDAEVLDRRVDLRATISHKRNHNVLLQGTVPAAVFGGSSKRRYDNVGLVVNSSVELEANTRLIDHPKALLTFRVAGNAVRNKVEKVGGSYTAAIGALTGRFVREGYPFDGVGARPVLWYHDVDGNGVLGASEVIVADSVQYLGWAQPKYSLVYGSSFSILNRRLTFTAGLSQDVGATQILQNRLGGTFRNSSVRGLVDVTTPYEEQVWVLQMGDGLRSGRATTYSVVRINSASVAFEVPQVYCAKFGVRAMNIQLSSANLGMWTNYRGRDPGVNQAVGSEQRLDPGDLIGKPRSYSFTVRVGL